MSGGDSGVAAGAKQPVVDREQRRLDRFRDSGVGGVVCGHPVA